MQIQNVDWQITSRCNRNCPYCFGPSRMGELRTEEAFKVVDTLHKLGTKQIGITGGEPLLRPDISEILSYIHDSGIKIYFSTNCDMFSQYERLIFENVSIVGIPVDGSTAGIHDKLRGKGSFSSVLYAMQRLAESKVSVKIGTVLTKENFWDLENIEKLVARHTSHLLFWKIYEPISYARNQEKIKHLKLYDKKEIIEKIGCLGNVIDKKKIVYDTVDLRNRSYFFIRPNGDVFIPVLDTEEHIEHRLGNILDNNISELLAVFEECCSWDGYLSNIRYMRGE